MSRISEKFKQLQAEGQKAFIPFLMAGDPNMEITKELVLEAEARGADIIELGLPYSTPLADGPTIKKAGKRSLEHQTNLDDIFKLVAEIRAESEIPLVLMGYYNLVFKYGVEKFVQQCEEAGVDGTIIPDLPIGEDEDLRSLADELDIISLVTTTSKTSRVKEVAQKSQGFIYAVSTPGTTGARTEISSEIEEKVEELRELTTTPIAVGFGISKPEHVAAVTSFADGAIVGSAIIRQLEANLDQPENIVAEVGDFIDYLTEEIKN
ncbi:MAG: tryptophan synthase subunit alpha [Halanaerobacter sp.]